MALRSCNALAPCRPRHVFQPVTSVKSRLLTDFQLQASKGFGTPAESTPVEKQAVEATSSQEDAIEALEARMRSRRAKRVEPKVQVESAVRDAVQGKTPITPQQQAEGTFVTGMLFLFGLVIVEGLVIAGSGFLPEDWDAFIEDVLYPNYTSTVLLFLAASTAYGLWKVGKLPLPFLGAPPPPPKDE